MPGLVGLVTAMPRERAEAELKRMVGTLRHEPFYQIGTWCNEAAGVYLGWSGRPGAVADGRPICDEQHGVVLAFAGDDFPPAGTADRVPSYLLRQYQEDQTSPRSPSFPSGLNGRFHGLLVDRRRQTTTIFNDRYGMHRLYYYESKDAFYFAAEAKAILAVRPETRRIDPKGMGEFVSCGCVLENRTLFDGVRVLPSGSRWVFCNRAIVERGTYFDPREWEEQPLLDPEAY